ncbi:hypothetical protein HY449_02000 [Candidatus Pacearchaeota archaeon]|nr:hypothetical protein [Candidatus Pacearchaeota archaeon]
MTKTKFTIRRREYVYPAFSEDILRKIEVICINYGLKEKNDVSNSSILGGNFGAGAPGISGGNFLETPHVTEYVDESENIFSLDRTVVEIRRSPLGYRGVFTRRPIIGGSFRATVLSEMAEEILRVIPVEKRNCLEKITL